LRVYTELEYKRPHGNFITGGRLFFSPRTKGVDKS
jgi:hypothetical protein